MTIEETAAYKRQLKKLIKKRNLTREEVENTIQTFLDNPYDHNIEYKVIYCKVDKRRHSMRIIGTQYRILVTDFIEEENRLVLRLILNHDDYQRTNKNC